MNNNKVEAAGRLLAAEVDYLGASGWLPITTGNGAVFWRRLHDDFSFTQAEALAMQKARDNYPNVRG